MAAHNWTKSYSKRYWNSESKLVAISTEGAHDSHLSVAEERGGAAASLWMK